LSKSDSYIIDGCKQGDPVAQNQLFLKYRSMLFGVCLRYGQNRPEAEDLLQDVKTSNGECLFATFAKKTSNYSDDTY